MQKCTKNLLNYWIKPTKQRIRYQKIQELAKIFFQIGRRAGAIPKLTSSKSSPITSEYLSSTSLSSVADSMSNKTDRKEKTLSIIKKRIYRCTGEKTDCNKRLCYKHGGECRCTFDSRYAEDEGKEMVFDCET